MPAFNRAAAAAVLGVAMILAAMPAQAGRSIRVDLPGGRPFDETGELWASHNDLDFATQPLTLGTMPFRLNFSGSSGSGGFLPFAFNGDFAALELGSGLGVIYPYFPSGATPTVAWDIGGEWSVGRVDTEGPYDLADAVSAIRFSWYGHLSTGAEVDVQLVFLDRSADGSLGDFDLELNYGLGSFRFPSGGAQYLAFGDADPLTGGVTRGPITALCFRDGVGTECAPDEVPEPSSFALLGLGLAAAGLTALRRRQRPTTSRINQV